MSKQNGFACLTTGCLSKARALYRRAMASPRRAALLAGGAIVALATTVGHAEAAPYQERVFQPCPGFNVYCNSEVVTVPADKRIQVTSVSCYILVAQNVEIEHALMWKTPGLVEDYFVPTPTVDRRYFFNTQTLFFANPGETLSIGVKGNGDVQSLQCKIAGTIANLP
jgi:hypothetical protein